MNLKIRSANITITASRCELVDFSFCLFFSCTLFSIKFDDLPAHKVILAQAHLVAINPGHGGSCTLNIAVQFVVLEPVHAPRLVAWAETEAGLLGVDGEHGELRLQQSTWNEEYEMAKIEH